MPTTPQRPDWWGGRGHITFTIVVFVVLASLDNAALAVIPGMVNPLVDELGTSKLAIGVLTAATILVTALSSVPWGYWGDRTDRKRLLFQGTLIWSAGSLLSATATTYGWLFVWQVAMATGLGAVASVGFSVVSDLVPPRRRGLALSFWGLSQGIGTILGGLTSSQLGADDIRRPFLFIGVTGLVFAAAYLATFDVPRGFREPSLEGVEYDYRIERDQLHVLWERTTNRWLVLQGFAAQFAYGSLIWVPLLYQEKVIEQGYSTATATKVGGLFATLVTLGALTSILGGHIGDLWQARSRRGRALLSTIGILGAVPFFIAFFFVPLNGLDVTEGAGTVQLVTEVMRALITNPWVAVAFLTGGLAVALTSADSPNALAMIGDVNLPEHRGTVYGAANLANGVGRAAGNGLTSAAAGAIERVLAPPLNWAVGLAAFQLFFLPTGYCYWRASQTAPTDITAVTTELEGRGNPER
jgi:MFS family permease